MDRQWICETPLELSTLPAGRAQLRNYARLAVEAAHAAYGDPEDEYGLGLSDPLLRTSALGTEMLDGRVASATALFLLPREVPR